MKTTLSVTVGLSLLLSVISFSFNNFNSNDSDQTSIEKENNCTVCDPGSPPSDVQVSAYTNVSGLCCLVFTGLPGEWFSAYWGPRVTSIWEGEMNSTGVLELCYGFFPARCVCIFTSGLGCECFEVDCE